MRTAFEQVDAIVCPTSPTPAFKLGERTSDPLSMYLADIFTLAANIAGICGISVPCGFLEEEGKQLPVGLQILGKELNESTVLQVAHAYEQSTNWHEVKPALGREFRIQESGLQKYRSSESSVSGRAIRSSHSATPDDPEF